MSGDTHSCIFCRIVRGEIPSRKVYEDEHIFAFHDINPASPVHFLMVPKRHLVNLLDADLSHQALLGHLFGSVGKLARQEGLGDGFRVIVNNGKSGGQEVYHLHVHVRGTPGGSVREAVAE